MFQNAWTNQFLRLQMILGLKALLKIRVTWYLSRLKQLKRLELVLLHANPSPRTEKSRKIRLNLAN
jgi:hypothetical protein